MAELISKQTGSQLSPELRKKFSEVQHVKETGRIAIYGIDKKTKKKIKIGYRDYIKAWDKSPEPQRVDSLWQAAGGDIPVTIVGTYGSRNGGTEHLRALGTKTGIPRNEIKWPKNETKSDKETTTNLKAQVSELSSRFGAMEAKWNELEQRNQELEAANLELQNKNQELQAKLDLYASGNLPLVPEVNNVPSDSRSRMAFNRATGWIGSRVPWRGEPNYTNRRIEEKDGVPVIIATEERIDGYRIEDRRRGAAAILGAAAVIGVGVLAAGLWGEHEEQEGRGQAPTITLPATPHVEHDPTSGVGSRHEVLFHGNQAFKVSLPGNLVWQENANGSYSIGDINGHVVVPHVYGDQQGNLDQDSRKLLRTDPDHDFELRQRPYAYHTPGTDYNSHYETVVENK